jgi:TonB-linked SusC/RagA family outer membrane protein
LLKCFSKRIFQDVKVTIDFKEMKLKKALSVLEQKGDIRILYSEENLPSSKEVSLKVKDMPVLEALELLLKGTNLDYQVMKDGLVVVKPAKTTIANFAPIRGTVTDAAGKPVSGVSVTLKGTSTGTTTGADGKFTLDVPASGTLVISSVGYTMQEIPLNGQTEISVSMVEESQSLNTVVVTALGIRRDKKALSYSVTQVNGDDLNKAREINLGNALTGRVAGVNATSTATGPAGSSRVVIRGNGSLNGDNQPLYVVNGIPINNANQGNPGTFGGIDRGDGLISINPDDIESMSVLKGGTAAALYGSRAANGVIFITTKSGRGQKGLGVEYNGTYTWEKPRQLYDWQYEYGSGSRGAAPLSQADAVANGRMSWGAKLDGSSVFQPDGVKRPYSAQQNNLENFYNTGKTFSNTISFFGGSETANFRFSASNLDNKGIVANNSLNRKTFNLSINANLKKKLLFEANMQYNIENTQNRTFVADFQKNPNTGAS